MNKTKILAIVGSTASGKSALAMALAERLDGEIISCDSMQIYRRMDIGTAKPTAAEQAAVRLKCSAKKAELEEQYTALGKLTYEQTNAVSPSEKSEEIAQCIVRITELLDEIETLQATIENN